MNKDAWFEGVGLWYNNQDYLEAIQVWNDAVNQLDWNDNEHFPEVFPTELLQLKPPAGGDCHTARLLLFLAGCQLDGQNIRQARRSLIRCLRCCTGDFSAATFQAAIQELLCSYEEEAHVTNDAQLALETSRKIIQYAIDNGSKHWRDSYQRPGFMNSTIQSQAHYAKDDRPKWCDGLEENWTTIQQEFLALARNIDKEAPQHWPQVGSSDHRDGAGQHDGKVLDGDWREIVLFGSGARPHMAPKTSALIQLYAPEAVSLAQKGGGEVIFSVLSPHTRIRAHCGPTNVRLTAHLGLVIPSSNKEECAIRVGEDWHTWKESSILVFDDSYEHEVINLTFRPRAVLLLRFWHPNLANNQREEALVSALEAKQTDSLRRYNPPLPSGSFAKVTERGLEKSRCSSCWSSGYTSIRMVQSNYPFFVCTCGQTIQ